MASSSMATFHKSIRPRSFSPTDHHLPFKRLRRSPIKLVKLTDLPDEILIAIMRRLLGSRTVTQLREPYLGFARHAFALALCNTHLLELFRLTFLNVISCAHGDLSKEFLLSRASFPRSRYQRPKHVQSIAWIADSLLREIEIPHYSQALNASRHVLSTVADFCPNVRRLSMSESSDVSAQLINSLFVNLCPRLESLAISGPRDQTLEVFLSVKQCAPTHLKLTNVEPMQARMIWECIQDKGRELKSLHVDFNDEEARRSCFVDQEECGPMRLLNFMNEYHNKYLSRLETLQLGLSSPTCFSHDYEGRKMAVKQFETLQKIYDILEAEDDKRDLPDSPLSFVRIGGMQGHIVRYVEEIRGLLRPTTRLETLHPGCWIVFPKRLKGARLPYFRAIQLYEAPHYVPELKTGQSSVFRALESIDVGETTETSGHMQDENIICLTELCSQAGDCLQTLRVKKHFRNTKVMSDIRKFLLKLRALAPKIRSLDISRELVSLMTSIPTAELQTLLFNIQNLRLSAPERYVPKRLLADAILNRRFDDNTPFIQRLPGFLTFVQADCANLKSIFLDKAGGIRGTPPPRLFRSILRSMSLIDQLEEDREDTDFSTLKTHLYIWREQSY